MILKVLVSFFLRLYIDSNGLCLHIFLVGRQETGTQKERRHAAKAIRPGFEPMTATLRPTACLRVTRLTRVPSPHPMTLYS